MRHPHPHSWGDTCQHNLVYSCRRKDERSHDGHLGAYPGLSQCPVRGRRREAGHREEAMRNPSRRCEWGRQDHRRESSKRDSPREISEGLFPLTPLVSPVKSSFRLVLQNPQRMDLCCFKSPACGILLAQSSGMQVALRQSMKAKSDWETAVGS